MQAQIILVENIEFLLAGLIAVVMLLVPRQQSGAEASVGVTVFDSLALSIVRLLPAAYQKNLSRQLNWSGRRNHYALARFASFKVYPAVLSLPLLLVVPALTYPLIALVLFFIPDLVLMLQIKKRQSEIVSSLPQMIDLMLLCVDAGLSLDATLQRIANDSNAKLSNPLNLELSHLGRDILLGMDRELAYQDLFMRTGVEELKSLAAALNQSGKLGLSISKILRAQSQFIRMRQRQKAEEKAARLPIWMAFPLWLTIMPSLFLILLGPSLIQFFTQLAPMLP